VVDTNVLVYTLDRREPEKRERAREVLRRVGGARTVALLCGKVRAFRLMEIMSSSEY
jgi:predicted nucleic acid-binding protein